MLRNVIKKLRRTDENFFISILKILYLNIIKVNRFNIYEFDLGQDFPSPSLDANKYTVQIIDHNELKKLSMGKSNLPREFDMHEIDGVRYCVLIMSGDNFGHISWIYLKGDKNRWFDLKEDEAHVNYSYTFQGHRGAAFFPNALLACAAWLKSRNYRRIIMDVHEETIFMVKSMKKIKEVKQIGVLKQWFIYRPKFTRIGLYI